MKKQKGFALPGLVIPIIIVIVVAVIFLGQRQPKTEKIPITSFQLMPSVSAKEARTTICNLKKEGLFAEACQSKFDVVGKDDSEKLAELFTLLKKVQDDKSLSDYDRLLLGQLVFAVLPTKDSPEANLYQPALLARLKDYLTSQNIVYAQEKEMSEEEFKKLMERDLQNVVDGLPKGNNAWVINVMVSKYSWIDGKSRPLYSHQFLEVFDPFPNNPNVNTRDISYHVRSIVGSKSSSQTLDVGGPEYKGTSDMIAYSFSIVSWNSQEYTGKDGPIEEEFLVKKENFSDSFYQGEYYLTNLLDAVKMPSTKRPVESPDKNESAHKFTVGECQEIGNILPTFQTVWSPEDYPDEICTLTSADASNISPVVEYFEDADISFANFTISYDNPEKIKELQEQDEPFVQPNFEIFQQSKLDVLGGKGKARVTTVVDEARTNEGNVITGYINSSASIYLGKCDFGYAGNSYVAYGSDRYTSYHYSETTAGKELNSHPNSDHGAARLHQIMVDMVPKVTEAVKNLCQ
ncbi:MAG: hypothetical protein Q8P92_02890 [Candidatus Daviesbacteria bacterium]|nr:hypothetical protein [Candidatus Daviesbacteria bacterium]